MSEAVKTRQQLKDKFVTGAKPTQQDFHDLLDAYLHKNDEPSGGVQSGTGDVTINTTTETISVYDPNSGTSSEVDIQIPTSAVLHPKILVGDLTAFQSNSGCPVIVSRTLVECMGKIYDNGRPGRIMNLYTEIEPAFDGDFVLLCVNGITSNIRFISGSDTATDIYIDGSDDLYRSINLSNNEVFADVQYVKSTGKCRIHVYQQLSYYGQQSYLTLGQFTYYNNNYNGMPIDIYSDENLSVYAEQADYGQAPYTHGQETTEYSLDSSKDVYIQLKPTAKNDLLNDDFCQMECYLASSASSLAPGTYYRKVSGSNVMEEVVVPESI